MNSSNPLPDGLEIDRRLLLLSPEDNCLIACRHLVAGTIVTVDGKSITLAQEIALGHKVARRRLKQGEIVMRYGAHIGSTLRAVGAGEHLHLHNLKSDYIPTYTLTEGERFAE